MQLRENEKDRITEGKNQEEGEREQRRGEKNMKLVEAYKKDENCMFLMV